MLEKEIEEWWKVLEARAMNSAEPINPQRVFWELSPRLPDNCILSSDSGSSANWFARDVKIRRGMMASLSGNLATMCPGVPYAIAAKFCYPERVAIALVGDGAMQMLGNNGLITISKYWKEWSDPRLVILVLNNRDLNQVTWEQRAMAGDPKYEASQDIPDFPFARYAELLGLRGIFVDKPEQIGEAWDQAFASDRPGRDRGLHRSERADAAAAHHLRTSRGLLESAVQRRSGRDRDHPADIQGRDRIVSAAQGVNVTVRGAGAKSSRFACPPTRIPTDAHESDGTFEWDATTLVLVEATGGDVTGLGFTYADTVNRAA